MIHTVYQITNVLNGKIYIGVHSTKNINDKYFGSGQALRTAIQKHGKANFQKTILYTFATRKEALDKERELVNTDFVSSEQTYNLVQGGAGCPYKYEHKKKYDETPYSTEYKLVIKHDVLNFEMEIKPNRHQIELITNGWPKYIQAVERFLNLAKYHRSFMLEFNRVVAGHGLNGKVWIEKQPINT